MKKQGGGRGKEKAIAYAEFQAFEFEGQDGVTRTFYGCSIQGLFEFDERIAELSRRLDEANEELTIIELYRRDRRFRFLCDRALLLNGIQPEWVTPAMLEQLLFAREEQEQEGGVSIRPGWLIELNTFRKQQPTEEGTTTLGTKAMLIAALAQQNNSLSEAFAIARSEPAKQVLEVLEAKAELSLTPEERQKKEQKNWAREQRKQAREAMNRGRQPETAAHLHR